MALGVKVMDGDGGRLEVHGNGGVLEVSWAYKRGLGSVLGVIVRYVC